MSAASPQNRLIEFFTGERKRLVGYARRLIADAADRDGEDIVQDVALNLFGRADVSLPIEHLSAYVYQAVRNRVVDALRRRRDMVSLDESPGNVEGASLADILADPALEADMLTDRHELRRRLFEALDDLPDDQKAVLIETEFHGRSFQELSEAWDAPVGTLLSRKSRAVAKVRAALQDLKP